MANTDEINKMVEIKDPDIEEEPKQEIIPKNKLIEVITEEEHIVMAREFVIDLSSYTMVNQEKRVKFSKDLKENKTINDFVNNQALFKIFKSNNEFVRAGVVYSYLYIKNLNCL